MPPLSPPINTLPPPASPLALIVAVGVRSTLLPNTSTVPPVEPVAGPEASTVPSTFTVPVEPPDKIISPFSCETDCACATPFISITSLSTPAAACADTKTCPPSASNAPLLVLTTFVWSLPGAVTSKLINWSPLKSNVNALPAPNTILPKRA